jgi:hypothetical protein
MAKSISTFTAIALAALAAGCGGDSQIKTYKVAKDDDSAKSASASAVPDSSSQPGIAAPFAGASAQAPALPHVHWELPKGWKEIPAGDMRVAAFEITGSDARSAQVTIIPLPGASGKELESVNMWREQLQLPAFSANEMAQQGTEVQVGRDHGKLFDMTSAETRAGSKFKTHMLGAIVNHENVLWFIKMLGDDTLVSEQKPEFIAFLKSLSFEPAPQLAAANKRPESTNTKKLSPDAEAPKLKVPPGWQEKAPGPMITAAYGIEEAGGSADVTITHFQGDVGGEEANVTRWRRQLGLPPVSSAEMGSSVQQVEVNGRKAGYRVDLKGTNARTGKEARMIAIAVPRGGETWFFKLMGDDAVVEKEKDAFQQFVNGAY